MSSLGDVRFEEGADAFAAFGHPLQVVSNPLRFVCNGMLGRSRTASSAPDTSATTPSDEAPLDQLPARDLRCLSLGFDKGWKSLAVAVNGPLTVDDAEILVRAAMDGLGLPFTLEEHVARQLSKGTLVRILEDWCPPFAGYFLYYPSRRQQPAALSALIEALRL